MAEIEINKTPQRISCGETEDKIACTTSISPETETLAGIVRARGCVSAQVVMQLVSWEIFSNIVYRLV